MEQHNSLIEMKIVFLSYRAIQGIHLIKKIFLLFYFGFSWSLVSYGSSFTICKTCFLHISTKLSVHNKKALQHCKMILLRIMIMPRFTRFLLNRYKNYIFVTYHFESKTKFTNRFYKVNNTPIK